MRITPVIIFISAVSLAGCGKSDIQGNAFVVKGGGDIHPAAGRTVYLIPEKSVDSLFARAIKDVTPAIMESYTAAIKPMCAPAKDAVTLLNETYKTKLQGIKNKENIPPSGCTSLQEDVVGLNGIFKEIRGRHLDKIAGIKSEIEDQKAKRDIRIKNHAKDLRKQALKKVRINFEPDDSGYMVGVTLFNGTEYYIKNKAVGDVLSKGVKIGIVEMTTRATYIEDRFGFKMDFVVSPNSKAPKGNAVMSSFFGIGVQFKPEMRLLVAKHGLPVNTNGYIVPNEIITTDVRFGHKPTKTKAGNIIKYSSKDVSFFEIASKNKYPEDFRIAALTKSLDKENKTYNNSDTYNDYSIAKTKADSCKVDKEAVATTNKNQTALGQIAVEVDSCLTGGVNTKKLYQALVSLGGMTDSPKPHDVSSLINEASAKHIVKIVTGEDSRKVDTTINGLFKFKEVPNGEYLLFSDYKDSFVNGFWLTPISVNEDAQFDLNNNTFKDQSFDVYLSNYLEKPNR